MKKCMVAVTLPILLILILFWRGDASAEEKPPVRIAVMPAFGDISEYQESSRYIYKSINNALHIPLNGILKKAGYLNVNEIAGALQEMPETRSDALQKQGMMQLSNILDADVLIGARVNFISQDTTYFFEDGPYLMSRVGVQLFIYDRRTDKYIKYSGQKFYNDTYSLQGTVDALTKDLMASLLAKADLKQYVQ
ncbi:hypothetical protein [Pectinatus haikarae]|uniref:TolB amino-terminal domain-containing protein n=1 Tax=Pectinatus haikarae TaxID=349096 RepID=A0ABT9Y7I1_9FIRM|nr:hypothetical protein [Pectinatus haikarae]MDQ0203172.1 hypothetical protein [Pectinatus haikarae]